MVVDGLNCARSIGGADVSLPTSSQCKSAFQFVVCVVIVLPSKHAVSAVMRCKCNASVSLHRVSIV